MRFALCALACFVLVVSESAAQDPNIRSDAVQLLEKANGLSMSPKLPDLERTDVFHVLDTSSPVREGTFRRIVIQGVGRREETTFGDYHVTNVWTHAGLNTARTSDLPPAEVDTVMRITPIYQVDFADDDVIHAIVGKTGADGQMLRCIQFETIRGKRSSDNEICVDAASGTLASQKIANELIEYSEFFPFAGAMLPGKISYWSDGVRKLDITQTAVELKDAPESVLTAPPNASMHVWCRTHKPAIGQSMPQPKEGRGGRDIDVLIRGIIGWDGRVHQAVVQSAERADLAEEALALVQQWVFTPAVCDGEPNAEENVFVLHFHGR